MNEEQERLSEEYISTVYWASERGRSPLYQSPTPSPPPVIPPQHLNETTLQYKVLDPRRRQIRLLQVEPGNGLNQPVICSLLTASLDQVPPFEALSYVWGHSKPWKPLRTIYIDGCPVDIRENLYKALLHLRSTVARRILWVDALCIDQCNKVELGDQVPMMGYIYAAANLVIVWLGEASGDCGSAFSLIGSLSRTLHSDVAVRELLKSPSSASALNSLAQIFRKNYWSRTWVIQEVHFAKSIKVHCGPYEIHWSSMVNVQNILVERHLDILDEVSWKFYSSELMHHIRYLRHAIQFQGPQSLALDREDRSGRFQQIELFEGLMMHRLKCATDPRDKIYAIVNLTKAKDDRNFVIDYKISAEQVFINTIDYVIRKSGNLDIILIHTKGFTRLDLPTWVPEFDSPGWNTPVPFRHAVRDSVYRASAARKAEANIDRDRGILTAHGIQIASINIICSSDRGSSYGVSIDDGIETVKLWKQHILTIFEQSPKQLGYFTRLLLCDIPKNLDSLTESALLHILEVFDQDLWPDSRDWDPLHTESLRSAEERKSRSGAQEIIHNIFKRSLFITNNSGIGMSQDSILEGDLVCILFGCSIPVILRKIDDHYIYISDACVVGYMYGKGIEELEEGKVQIEAFEIH